MNTEQARTEDTAVAAPSEEVMHIPNDDTIIVGGDDDGVIASPPDAPDTDVNAADAPEDTLMDHVTKALETSSDPDPKEAEAKETADGEEAGEEGSQPDLSAEPTDEELENYSKKAQSRIRSLIDQRNQAAERANEANPIMDFLESNDIPKQDLDVILDLTARLRHGDFNGFLTAVQPYVNFAMQHTGQVLPADLKEQVQKGYVSPQIAKELAQSRAQQQWGQQQSQQTQQRQQQHLVHERAGNIRNAVTQWEQTTRASDPDYDLKADVIRRTAQAYMQERGVPQTADGALEYVKMAYAEVNGQMKAFRPDVKATMRTPSSVASKGGTTPRAEPKTMLEAAVQGLEQHNRG